MISGIPGVGKTTLAQVLAAQEFVNGYEIVEISRDIDEALRVWDDDRLQLFYYDDFLGQTSLRDTVATNEDSRLIRFIRQIERAGNKLFILTTREYILAQAMQASEKLHTQALDVVKYLIDLESYSRLFRAEVLYNHIYFSKLPEANRAAFASEGVYSPIIRHRNFNPRLIALTLDAPETLTESPEESVRRVIANLDDPKALWDHMFKYQLSDEEVDLAELVFLSRLPMRLPELTTLWVNYSQRSARPRGGRQLTRTLASLEGTLLRVDRRDATIVVQLHNPSVRDYMRARLSEGYEHIDRALQGITEISQLETLWVTATGYEGSKILALLVERSDQFAERFLATIRYQDFSAWTGDWPTRVASYIEMAERLESHPISRAVAEIIENKRPEYVEDPGDYVQLFQAIRASRHAAIRNTEHSTLEWAIDDMEHDLHDWDVVSTVSATLSAIGGERADQESAKLAERLDDMARGEAERRAEERTSYVSESVAAEMLDHLSGYVNAEQEIYGYRELAHSVASARATREAQARAQDNQHRPQAPPSIPNEGEEAFIATMLGSLARIDG